MYNRILVPTDGSAKAEQAVEHAVELALASDAILHVLHVIDTRSGVDAGIVGGFERFEELGEAAVGSIAGTAEAAGMEDVTTAVVSGTPYRRIVDYSDEHGIDLIVMSTHGRTGLERYLIGSVTEKVVRTADVPVLTVPIGPVQTA